MKLEKLKNFALKKGFNIYYIDFKTRWGAIVGKNILLASDMPKEKEIYTIAHEIAHAYLHKDKGDTIESPRHKEYEEQANRTAELILDLLSMDSCNVGGKYINE